MCNNRISMIANFIRHIERAAERQEPSGSSREVAKQIIYGPCGAFKAKPVDPPGVPGAVSARPQ